MFTQKTFCVKNEEYDIIKKWAKTHQCTCKHNNRPNRSCCGGEISIIFTPTSIGTAISALCICGQELELNNL